MTERTSSDSLIGLLQFGFWFSIALFIYGTLFPFQFDFSPQALSKEWSSMGWLPFWDASRGRIHSLPDMAGNLLLTFPIGFFGVLRSRKGRGLRQLLNWGLLGLAMGFAAEMMQLALPSRYSDITDAINNGLGCLAGAWAAYWIGTKTLELLSGTLLDREKTYVCILILVIAATALVPFDVSINVLHVRHSLKAMWTRSWGFKTPTGDDWVLTAEFCILGALAGRMIRLGKAPSRLSTGQATATILCVPVILEALHFLVESHTPSLQDMETGLLAAGAGLIAGLHLPVLARPLYGFVLMNLSLLAAGLRPYHFVAPGTRSSFQWIPLYEYIMGDPIDAFSDALFGLLSYAVLAGLMRLSFGGRRWRVVAWAVAVAALIEFAQLFIPTRYAGITDILIAALGAWGGDVICSSIESRRVTVASESDL